MQRIASICIVLAVATAGLFSTGCNPVWPAQDKLDAVADALSAHLDALDADLAAAAAEIAPAGLDSVATRAALSALQADYPDSADCATVSPAGILTAVEPAEFHSAQGADISDQAQFITLRQTQQPVMSELFTAVEGFPALDFEYPLINNGALAGSVSILLKPADYLARSIEPVIADTGYVCNVLQLDGTILYHTNPALVGRNTFTDPLFAGYASLQRLARYCVEQPTGWGSFEFPNRDGVDVTKYARWTTVEFHGATWRVLLIAEDFAPVF